MDGNSTNQSANRNQEQQIGDSSNNRNSQSHFQNMINNNNHGGNYYQHQRSQQSPTNLAAQNSMGQQPQRTTRIFLPHQTTIKNQHQRQSSTSGHAKGVTFQKNRRPADAQQHASRDDSYEVGGHGQKQVDFYGADHSQIGQQNDASMASLHHQQQQNLQGAVHQNLDNSGNVERDEADISVSVSVQSRMRDKQQHKAKQEDYAFSPRDGQANVRHRILQPNFKKRTPSGVTPYFLNHPQTSQEQPPMNRGTESEMRKKMERVKTQEQCLSMSPPILRHGATDDSNAEDFAVENEEGEAEMSAINHNAKQSHGDGHNAVKEGTVYPRMFAGKFQSQQSQKKLNQMNVNRGGMRKQEQIDNYDKGSSPFHETSNERHFERAHGEQEDDGLDEPTCSQVFYQEDQEEKNADIQLPYSQTSSPNVNQEQRYSKGQGGQKRPSKLSTSKQIEQMNNQARKVQGAHTNSIGKQNQQQTQRDGGGKFALNLQGVQDKSTKLRKILSMRDPVTQDREKEAEDEDEEDQNSENVYDNVLSQGDLDKGADRMYSKQDQERNRIDSVRQQRAVHSPAEKFSTKKSNNPAEGRGKYTVKSSWKNQSKSNTAKVNAMQKNFQQSKQQNDLDNFNQNVVKSSNFQVRQKSGNRALIKFENMTSGSQSARGPQTTIRGFSHSRMPISFQNQMPANGQQQNQQQQTAQGWQPANMSASRKTFNQTQKLTLKGSSSTNLTVKKQQFQKGWMKQMIDDNSDNAEYNFIDQLEQDGEHDNETSPSKLDSQGLMEMPKTNHLMSQRNRISNISGKGVGYPWHSNIKETNELMTPSTLMPQQMKISPSKRKNGIINNNNNNQVVMMMHNVTSSAGASTGVTDDRMRRKGRGQQEQGNPKQTSEKYNIYNNPVQAVQASQVYMPDNMEQIEQDEDLGQEFSSPYSQYPNQQQKPRKSSVRLSNPDEERQEQKNQNMHNMIPSASQDFSSKLQHYNRLPAKQAQMSFGKKINFKGRPRKYDKNVKMPYSIFDQFKQENNELSGNEFEQSNQKSPKPLGLDFTQEQLQEKPASTTTKQNLFSDKRVEKLYDEIYNDESGAFFGGFFSSSDKNKKDIRRLETYYGTNESQSRQRDPRMSPPNMSDTDFSSNSKNFNTFRDAQFHKEEYLQKKKQQKVRKQSAKEMQAANDPLALLWQELMDQDEELIFSESCQLISDNSFSSTQRMAMTSMSNLYASGIESSRAHMSMFDNSLKAKGDGTLQQMIPKPTIIQYDYYGEVHNDAQDFAMSVTSQEQMVHFFVCHQKKQCLQEFMKAKNKHLQAVEDQTKFSLRNSIIPAIQGHILILMDMPIHYKDKIMATALSSRNVLYTYHQSCSTVQNWLQSNDFGPLEQNPEVDPITGERQETAGACLSASVSTKEFYDLKLYQVDEELPDSINSLFNPISSMYYVDRMGNLLKSIKQSFYEKPEDKSYISKMFSSDNNTAARESLCKSYDVVREIYESLLQPKRQKQLRYVSRLYQQDIKDARLVGIRIKDGFNVEDLNNVSYLNIDMHSDKSPTGLTFFDLHAHSILDVSFFTMTTHQYMKVLLGLPEYDKNLGDNTQVLLKAKIDILKKSLVKSNNEHELELVHYIQFLKSQKYNCNVFGKFNPITINEEEIIEQMAKRMRL